MGRGGWGLSHIIQKRHEMGYDDGETFVTEILARVLAEGELVRKVGPPHAQRAILEYENYRAVLPLTEFGEPKTWLLTAYEIEPKKK